MKILFTNNALSSPAGSELVVVELADSFLSRGHQVAAYSTNLGEVADRLRGLSIPVISDPLKSPFVPDVIHGQHHLDTMAALYAFPNSPAIYHCHGYVPWVERSPRHPRIHRYVGMCEVISERLRIELALPDAFVTTIANWVDVNRFQRVRQPSERPTRALIYMRSFDSSGWHGRELDEAFNALDIQLDRCNYGDNQLAPEVYLPEYDIVLASGRSALEAMASGCAVIPLSAVSCMDFVTVDNFDHFKRQNFSPRLQSPQFCASQVRRILGAYSSEDALRVTERVRSQCTLAMASSSLESVYRQAIAGEQARVKSAEDLAAQEFAAILDYLRFLKGRNQRCEELEDQSTQLELALLHCQAELARSKQVFSAERDQIIRMLAKAHSVSSRLLAKISKLLA